MSAEQTPDNDFEADKHKMDKYSRQIEVYGVGVMSKMAKMKVLVIGLKGIGIETAKNLVLAGVGGVTLYDDELVKIEDLGTNFYLKESVVGKVSVAEASLESLKSLNPLVHVDLLTGELNSKHVKKFAVVVDCGLSPAQAVVCDAQCRRPSAKTKYIRARVHGLVGYMFNDFGDKFMVSDKTGEQPVSRSINSIERSDVDDEIIVRLIATKHHNIDFDDHVNFIKFDEVDGELGELLNNTKTPFMVKENTMKKNDGGTAFDPYSFRVVVKDVKLPAKIEYSGGGIINQIKVPVQMDFKSLEESLLNPVHKDEGMLPFTDGAKFQRADQLHIALNGLWKYENKHGSLPKANDEAAVNEVVDLAKEFNEAMKSNSEYLSVDELDEEIVANLARYAECNFQPLCCFFGGVVAQEVVKHVGKFTPLRQWLHLDFFEVLPGKLVDKKFVEQSTVSAEDRMPLGSRYDDFIKIFGKTFHQKIMKSKTFMVGCGALGCELLKNFALIGFACDESKEGLITVTDNDRIEVSNLSRQFLFRENNVGQPKSTAAGASVKEMNQSINIKPLQALAQPQTENIFNASFWGSLDFVTNALDNVKAREYIDDKCVFYGKPLLESGTLGTKCNSQVIVPHMTESYADGPKGEQGEEIPMCTLRNFPSEIEHCIEWARSEFQGLFNTEFTKVTNFLKDPDSFIKNLRAKTVDRDTEGKIFSGVSSEKDSVQEIHRILSSVHEKKNTFESCVQEAFNEFHKSYRDRIESLIKAHPEDSTDDEGNKFWDKTKRFPQAAKFDSENSVHVEYVISMANILALCYGVVESQNDFEKDVQKVKDIIKNCEVPVNTVMEVDLSEDASEKKGDSKLITAADVESFEKLLQELVELGKSDVVKNTNIEPSSFEKDDDENFHIDFITAASNLRAWNYRLKPAPRHKVKIVAGKIIPALATTTAAVTGLVMIEMLKLMQPGKQIEAFRDSSNSLAVNSYLFMEPNPARKEKDEYDQVTLSESVCLPSGFTKWDKIIIKGEDLSVSEFFEALIMYCKDNFEKDVVISSLSAMAAKDQGEQGEGRFVYSELFPDKSVLTQSLKDVVVKIYGERALSSNLIRLECLAQPSEEDTEIEYKLAPLIYQFGSK